jgi:hypothetical protein
MWFYNFFFFLFLSLIYLAIVGVGVIYLYMGFVQLVAASREENEAKRSGGVVSFLISLIVIILASYCYFSWVWLW